VGGNVSGSTGVSVFAGNGGTTAVTVVGDVTGKTGLSAKSVNGGKNEVVITGKLKGDDIFINFDGDGAANTSLTVWEIAGNNNQLLINGSFTPADIENFQKNNIHYIVRMEQPEAGTLSAVYDDDGSALGSVEYTKAGETETTKELTANRDKTVRLTASAGYRIESATYNGSPLAPDANGNYVYTVPVGGGMLFSAVLVAVPVNTAPGVSTAGFDSGAAVASIVVLNLVFDLDGGTLDGQTGACALSAPQGKDFKLPGAPVKAGFRCVGWAAEIDGGTVIFAPGGTARLDKPVTLRPVWEAEKTVAEAGMHLGLRE
jgi:hypothetical protein